ncbi:copper homeostasis protein CutC [Vibrio sinaloensis]|uniref:copper homeostasis protein CutC n=1 Tax=Photobacterium sp. (strain ATCC 43367) TaxID=379097 RepID=UPI0022AEEA32|nr:copper homeostasis protein CutC [Vibrio sinaloensis]MCZ4295424.1 copper homeostasis protein CutC [Vibrio sinaloensis]
MKYHIEVCIDNLESLHYAIKGGATRIELCSSLALGGLTPSFGLMNKAAQIASIPVYAMIRPRQGDFVYDQDDIDSMLLDIEAAAEAGLQGVVLGVLTPEGKIDMLAAQQLADKAKIYGLGITFHRAIDQCVDWQQAIEDIVSLGCERILTSGLAANAELGIDVLKQMVTMADGRISIMAGAGLNAENAQSIVTQTRVREVHLSGKTTRPSKMQNQNNQTKMGNQDTDDYLIPVTSSEAIEKVVKSLSS